MSQLSHIEKLLDGVEVEWKALGEVTTINTGQKPSDVLDVPTAYDYINAGTSRSGYSTSSNCEGDTVTTPSRGQGGIGYVGYQRQPFWLGALCYQMKSVNENILINKYLFYFLQSRSQLLLALKKEGGVPAVNKSDLAKLEIPVPPLTIQAEIVRILDTFTELTAELTAELVARKQQYAYYREQLLTLDNGNSEIKNLNEICTMRAGQHISASKILADSNTDYIYPCFGGNGIRGFVDKNSHDGSYLLVGRQGALCGNVHRMSGKFYATEHAVVVTAREGINIDWAFHMLTLMNLNQYASKSAQPGLTVGKLASLKVSVPPLDEQERIASILDKFDALTTSLTEGLPREIALRQQQYEYYRELLLSFPKPEVANHD